MFVGWFSSNGSLRTIQSEWNGQSDSVRFATLSCERLPQSRPRIWTNKLVFRLQIHRFANSSQSNEIQTKFKSRERSRMPVDSRSKIENWTIIIAKYLDRWITSQNSIKQPGSESEILNIKRRTSTQPFPVWNLLGMCTRQPRYLTASGQLVGKGCPTSRVWKSEFAVRI